MSDDDEGGDGDNDDSEGDGNDGGDGDGDNDDIPAAHSKEHRPVRSWACDSWLLIFFLADSRKAWNIASHEMILWPEKKHYAA